MIRHLRLLLCLAASLASAQAMATEWRTFDGTNNNLSNAQSRLWGSAGVELLRMAPADYRGDAGFSAGVNDRNRLAGRAISNLLSPQTTSVVNARGMTSGVWQWGQFLDHDITLSATNPAETSILYSPDSLDPVQAIPFSRSVYNTDSHGDRQQINEITSYIDGSNVYGSGELRAGALREYSGGLLRTSAGGLLMPTSDMAGLSGIDNANEGPESVLFVGGDVRSNEQLGLIAMHTLFVREHNRLAGELSNLNPAWDDERLYQTARRIVGAEVQAITYNEFLPALLGPYAPQASDYLYDAGVNAGIANEFSTAFFRVGHSVLPDAVQLSGDNGVSQGTIPLKFAFFSPSQIINEPDLVEKVLMGLTMQQSQEIDTLLNESVRSFLFAPNGSMGLDLAALNLQRGRDHGLPDYNTLRDAYGLAKVDSFDDITSDGSLQSLLAQAYQSVDNIDPWMGALAEDHLPGASMGPLMTAALIDQFTRLRDGDRFFFAGDDFLDTLDVTAMIDFSSLTMMDIMDWNTSMQGMPGSFFMAVPEPAALALVGLLVMGLAGGRRVSLHR